MQYDGQWFRDRRHGNGSLTIEAAGKACRQPARRFESRCCIPTTGNGKPTNDMEVGAACAATRTLSSWRCVQPRKP